MVRVILLGVILLAAACGPRDPAERVLRLPADATQVVPLPTITVDPAVTGSHTLKITNVSDWEICTVEVREDSGAFVAYTMNLLMTPIDPSEAGQVVVARDLSAADTMYIVLITACDDANIWRYTYDSAAGRRHHHD